MVEHSQHVEAEAGPGVLVGDDLPAQAYHAAATDAFAEDEGVNLPPVDTENPTGALGLYERAGMRRELRQDNWVVEVE